MCVNGAWHCCVTAILFLFFFSCSIHFLFGVSRCHSPLLTLNFFFCAFSFRTLLFFLHYLLPFLKNECRWTSILFNVQFNNRLNLMPYVCLLKYWWDLSGAPLICYVSPFFSCDLYETRDYQYNGSKVNSQTMPSHDSLTNNQQMSMIYDMSWRQAGGQAGEVTLIYVMLDSFICFHFNFKLILSMNSSIILDTITQTQTNNSFRFHLCIKPNHKLNNGMTYRMKELSEFILRHKSWWICWLYINNGLQSFCWHIHPTFHCAWIRVWNALSIYIVILIWR